jgi:hypothetical protein
MRFLTLFASPIVLCLFANTTHCADFSTIYSFRAGHMPVGPQSTLINGPNGVLYGSGDSGVFELTPPVSPGGAWTEATLIYDYVYSMPLALGPSGNIYGIATHVSVQYVFSLTPPASPGGKWTENVLFTLNECPNTGNPLGCPDGSNLAQLAVGSDGTVYGITTFGGASTGCNYGCGTVFSLTPPSAPGGAWTQTVLHSFTGQPDGDEPTGLTLGPDGTLYITASGGESGHGGIFALAPPAAPGDAWTEDTLYSFKGRPDGTAPRAAVTIGKDGTLYGTSWGGTRNNGIVFRLLPPKSAGAPWKEKVLYRFKGIPDGRDPSPGLALGPRGEIYGATLQGGESLAPCKRTGCGTVFELLPPASSGAAWTETLLETFPCRKDGCQPYGGLVASPDGAIYGTTGDGGSKGNGGTAFRIQP